MPLTRLTINTLSGGVGRQAPSKRLTSEAENLDNCLVTLEKSVEKRPPLSAVETSTNDVYLDVANITPPTTFTPSGTTNFNTDNLYFHFLDIDGNNRYCIIINRAGYTFDPVAQNNFSYSGVNIKLDNFVTVYRIEPTEWVKETVDSTFGINNTSGFNRGIFEYLTFGNRSVTTSYRTGNEVIANVPTTKIKDTFGSTDFDVGIILWNKLVPMGFLPDNSGLENNYSAANWGSSFATNEYIHSGDVINYKRSLGPQTANPLYEDTINNNAYWTNVRDDIILEINPDSLEEEELGQSLENFGEIPQYPATEVYNDVRDANGYKAWRTLYDYIDVPRLVPIPGGVIDWTKDHYHQTSPLPVEDRDGNESSTYKGLGKVYFARNPYLSFPAGFYRATRYKTNPYFERVRAEGPDSVIDHRRFPIIIYKDTSDGQWRVKHMPLFPRRAGTSLSNPGPTAIKRKEKVQSMTIWKNRLWVASDNTLFASRTNNYYNFWVDDVANVTETDPIDLQASVGAYNRLTHIVPFQSLLFALSSGSTQFEVRGGSIDTGISPFNVEFRPTSFYSTSKLVAPQRMGNNIFFVNNSKLYMYLSGSGFSDEFSTSMDISNHCRDYIAENISVFTAASAVNSLLMVDEDNEHELYFFTFRTNGDKIAQNAFYKWILDPLDNIKAIKSYEKDLYLVSKRTGPNSTQKLAVYFTSLESVPVTTPMVDWLYKVDTGNLALVSGETFITLPYYDPSIDFVILAPEWTTSAYQTFAITLSQIWTDVGTGLTKVKITGDYTAFPVYVGRSYEMNIELSQQVQRSSQDPSQFYEGVLNLKRITTRHLNSGSYNIVVERRGRTATTTTFFPLDTNSLLDLTGELKIDGVGEHFTKLLSYSEACKIYIKSSYPTPCNISNIEILGNFRSRNTSIE